MMTTRALAVAILVVALDAQRAGDPAYRTAYRDCMKSRGGRGR